MVFGLDYLLLGIRKECVLMEFNSKWDKTLNNACEKVNKFCEIWKVLNKNLQISHWYVVTNMTTDRIIKPSYGDVFRHATNSNKFFMRCLDSNNRN